VLPGLDTSTRKQRKLLFGANEIEIEAKSIPQLLVEEVRASAVSEIAFPEINMGSRRLSIRFMFSRLSA
jgi:hypothetical protein